MEPLISGLPDKDKWANFFVEVHRNFEFDNKLNRNHSVPKIANTRGLSFAFHNAFFHLIELSIFALSNHNVFLAELGPITRSLQVLAKPKHVETLKA